MALAAGVADEGRLVDDPVRVCRIAARTLNREYEIFTRGGGPRAAHPRGARGAAVLARLQEAGRQEGTFLPRRRLVTEDAGPSWFTASISCGLSESDSSPLSTRFPGPGPGLAPRFLSPYLPRPEKGSRGRCDVRGRLARVGPAEGRVRCSAPGPAPLVRTLGPTQMDSQRFLRR